MHMRFFFIHVVEKAVRHGFKGGVIATNLGLAKAVANARYNIRGTEKVITSEVKDPMEKDAARECNRIYLADKEEFDAIMRNLR